MSLSQENIDKLSVQGLHKHFYKELDELRQYYDDEELLEHLPNPIQPFELEMLDFVRDDVNRFSKLHKKLFGKGD